MTEHRVVVIGAGIGGLVAALVLAHQGLDVTVVEAASGPGGKMREVEVAGRMMDAGPTVFTMRPVFESLFDSVGESLSAHLMLQPVTTLARHAWPGDTDSEQQKLDLFASRTEAADAIARFASPAEARNYLAFCEEARAVHDSLYDSFMTVERPSPLGLVKRAGFGPMLRTKPWSSMWSVLQKRFGDPRLQQLFGRYATYCGSSPFLAPATLMLIAHVEQEGVWLIEGGMRRLANVLADLIEARGGRLCYNAEVSEILVAGDRAGGVRLANGTHIEAAAVVANADSNALASGHFGEAVSNCVKPRALRMRSLSAVTWNMVANTSRFDLVRHNVFFSQDYRAEFQALVAEERLPDEPTVYVCAQDRDDTGALLPSAAQNGAERLLVLVNAPPNGDTRSFNDEEIDRCQQAMRSMLDRCGLSIGEQAAPPVVTTPNDFARMFPATGGSLYGQATHGAMASFARPGTRTKVRGLYLAGGSVHPGAGVPMVAISGQLAARAVLADLVSTRRSFRTAIHGGTLTR